MKNSLYFLLGVLMTITMSSTMIQNGFITVKPAQPKKVVLIDFDVNARTRILKYSSEGYVIANSNQYFFILYKY